MCTVQAYEARAVEAIAVSCEPCELAQLRSMERHDWRCHCGCPVELCDATCYDAIDWRVARALATDCPTCLPYLQEIASPASLGFWRSELARDGLAGYTDA